MPKDRDINRGGSPGQEGEIPQDPSKRDQPRDLGKRDQEKQRGGIGREPSPEEKQKIPPTRPVD
jgi:hypothetical protein